MTRFHAVRALVAVGTVLLVCWQCIPAHADAQAGPSKPAAGAEGLPGDAMRGQTLFEGKGRCATCHRVNGKGSRVAPDLSTVGVSGTPEGLRRSLIDPTGAMKPINRPIRAVTKDGKVITGRRLNEDTHTVQLLDSQERLLQLEKSDLKEYVIGTTSPMPSYKDTLTPAELDDVVAYLMSLKGILMNPVARISAVALVVVGLASFGVQAQVSPDRLLNATQEPQNWLTYSGSYSSQRHSPLKQIDVSNVKNLKLQWIYQAAANGPWQATPLVVDGMMYVTQRLNDVVALDAKTGRVFWIYRYNPRNHRACCGANNRGLAILGDTLFMATLDAHLVAIDTKSGRPIWNTTVADIKERDYALTVAPLVIKDKVILGVSGGDHGIRGFIAAYDANTGKEAWRFNTIPAPGEPGHETWQPCPPGAPTTPTSPDYCDPNAWEHGGGAIWITGSYDPALNLTYWGIGNPGPDWNPTQRPGDNLYTNSVVALNADTGKLAWHFQFTPHDGYDYDSTQIPILADVQRNGTLTKVMLFANRNGFFYMLNRVSGEFLRGTPYIKMNWAKGLDRFGRPIETPPPSGAPTYPGHRGGTSWFSPSYSPRTGLFYVSTWQDFGSVYKRAPQEFRGPGSFNGGALGSPLPLNSPTTRGGPINNWTEVPGTGALLALDPVTGAEKWRFAMTDVAEGGILTTASDLLFMATREGYFYGLNARTGAILWRTTLGGQTIAAPVTYEVDGKQYVAVVSGQCLAVFALGD